jgi:hypothetical protein
VHPFVHRRRLLERPAHQPIELERVDVDELPEARQLLPFWARDLRGEVLEAFREARRGKT